MKVIIECETKEMADFIKYISQPCRDVDEKIDFVFEKLLKKQPTIGQL